MNPTAQELVDKAISIRSGIKQGYGARYPDTLKKIVRSLVISHRIPPSKVASIISISDHSIKKWSAPRKYKKREREVGKKGRTTFKRISLLQEAKMTIPTFSLASVRKYLVVFLVLQVLQTTLLLFLR